jgi:hypothetical protein
MRSRAVNGIVPSFYAGSIPLRQTSCSGRRAKFLASCRCQMISAN